MSNLSGLHKSPLRSKTIWFNTLVGIMAALSMGGIDLGFDTPALKEISGSIAVLVAAVGNVWLRFVTQAPIR